MGLKVRVLRREDLLGVEEVILACIAPGGQDDEEVLTLLADMGMSLSMGGGAYYVALEGKDVVGIIGVMPFDPASEGDKKLPIKIDNLWEICIHYSIPTSQDFEVDHLLFGEVIAEALKNGVNYLAWKGDPRHKRSWAFYGIRATRISEGESPSWLMAL